MSHFLVAVILKKEHAMVAEEKIADLLAPYDENTEMAPYETPCSCIGRVAKLRAQNEVAHFLGTQLDEEPAEGEGYYEIRRRYIVQMLERRGIHWPEAPSRFDAEGQPSERFKVWEQASQAYQDHYNAVGYEVDGMIEEAAKRMPDYNQPDPTCGFYDQSLIDHYPEYRDKVVGQRYEDGSGCGATGVITSTYNPDSKWDYWTLDGRWENEAPTYNGTQTSLMEDVVAFHKDDPQVFPAYAVVTPDGTWIEKGKMGWFGMSDDKMTEGTWDECKAKLAHDYADHVVAFVDCHI